MDIGFRISPNPKGASASLIQKFKEIPTPIISDNLHRLYGTQSNLTARHASQKLLGNALTVKTRSGDNLMVHKAIDMAAPGDVIVVDADGDTTQAILGEIMLRIAEKNGIAGFVVDGAIRDSKAFYVRDFPCFAKGVTHRGPYKEGPGEINVPVTIGNMIIHPGDIIVGDEDGLVAVPRNEAEHILERGILQLQKENETFALIAEGKVDRSWINKSLQDKGCGI